MEVAAYEGPGFDSELRDQVQGWGIVSFTDVQEKALDAGVAEGNSMVVCAPTSSGKTLVGEMALASSIRRQRKGLYLVSHKALADQKYEDFEIKFGQLSPGKLATVGLSTGDREEGEANPAVLVATYEKALALLLSGQLDARNSLVIADELQIIGEDGRGPNIEALCSVLRHQKVAQFVALTATVENPQDIAGWLECGLVISTERDVSLQQEIWSEGKAYSVVFGQEEGVELDYGQRTPSDALSTVDFLLAQGRGPVLVFTESRREASDYANTYSQHRSRTTDGLEIAQQLDLFSEPTEASEQLQAIAERNIAFHTADLTPQERQVVEQGFIDAKFQVCFATSTLAAGVNFPFQSVVFPKLTYQWGDRAGRHLARSEYRNMSGRAGRLGMHDRGYAILLPENRVETAHAAQLILPENDNVYSQLVNLSMRRTVLMLVSSGTVDRRDSLVAFFQNTYFWYLLSEKNPANTQRVIESARQAIDWLIGVQLIEEPEGCLLPTPLGKAVAGTGLLPTTAIAFVELLAARRAELEDDFDSHLVGILHWVCTSDEFQGEKPSRFLVYPSGRRHVASTDFLRSNLLLAPLDRTNYLVNECAHALSLYAQGVPERKIRFQTNRSSGGVHRLAVDVGWVLDGLHRISCVPELGCPQQLTNKLSMLARRVRWGAPAEALDIIRIAHRHRVPGFGRQRAMALLAQGIDTLEGILGTAKERLEGILKNGTRVDSLLAAVSNSLDFQADRFTKIHRNVAAEIGLDRTMEQCEEALGTEYEEAIAKFLSAEPSWTVTPVDEGKRQNVPDLLVKLDDMAILIECKTTTKNPPLIKKDEAFAVLQKAVDFDPSIHRVTLGKPKFDEHSKKKAMGASEITLIEHSIFTEGLLRVLTGTVAPIDFLRWLSAPGVSEIERLDGTPTFEIANS